MARHLVFIDDSGTKEYARDPALYVTTGNTRYFTFGAVILTEDAAALMAHKIATEKRRVFGTSNLEIKSNWLRMPRERRARYLEPFGITDELLAEFVGNLYSLIDQTELVLIAAVVDKVHMQEEYRPPRSPWYPPAVAYEYLLQRVVQHVAEPASIAVFVDDMSGATPKGSQYKENLTNQHHQLRTAGSRLQKGLSFNRVEPNLSFIDSAKSHMIQVADVVSYNVYRQFVQHGEAWEDTGDATLPTYPWFEKIGRKFRCGAGGRVQGYGIVKAPMRKRVPWTYSE
jgi:hypothetical protein